MVFCCCLVTKLCPSPWTPWTVALQAPLSMGFPRQEYWSGLPCPSPENLSDPGIKSMSPVLAGNSSPLSHLGSQVTVLPSKNWLLRVSRLTRPQTLYVSFNWSLLQNILNKVCVPLLSNLSSFSCTSSYRKIKRLKRCSNGSRTLGSCLLISFHSMP